MAIPTDTVETVCVCDSYLGRLNISEVYLAGVGSALKEHSQAEPKGIKAHFNMDESGLLNLTNVRMYTCTHMRAHAYTL